MTPDEVNAFLDAKPGWMVLTTIGADGFPHSVPLGYFRLGDDICLGCIDCTQKVRNVERTPEVSVLVETSEGSHLRGVMIQGRAEVVRDPAARLELARAAARLRGVAEEALPAQATPGAAYIRIRRHKVISWVYD